SVLYAVKDFPSNITLALPLMRRAGDEDSSPTANSQKSFSLATTTPDAIKKISATKHLISLSPSVNDAAIVAEGKRYDKATCSLIRMFSGTIAR
ncbi:hypothetical protein J8874_27740, partial [Klebsiella pneumoniae]